MGTQNIRTEFWRGNHLKNVYLEGREGDGKVALVWIIERWRC